MTLEQHKARRASNTTETSRAIVLTTEGPQKCRRAGVAAPTLRHAVR